MSYTEKDHTYMALASAEITVKIDMPTVTYTYFDNAKIEAFQIAIDLAPYMEGTYFRDKYFGLR